MNRSVLIAIALTSIALLWLLSGSFKGDTTSPSPESDKQSKQIAEATNFKVKVQHLVAQNIDKRLELQGEIAAFREIDIRSETQGLVTTLHARKGDTLRQGSKILSIDLSDRLAKLEQAKAELALRQADLEAGLSLQAKNLLSKNQQAQNRANVLAAQAKIKAIEVEIEQTDLRAAFPGVLNELLVEQGDYLSKGDRVARLVDISRIKLLAHVPQQYIADVALGQTVSAQLIDGTALSGKITYISNAADPLTRSFQIEALADKPNLTIYAGQSARVAITLGNEPAHKLSPSVLELDHLGNLQVKGVDEQNRVITQGIEMLRNEADGIWVSGLPEQFTLITVGQGFVSKGDKVTPIKDETRSEKVSQR